jgi:hypothetical protein
MYRFNKETLDFEKISILKYFKYLLAIIAIMFTIGFATAPRAEVKNLSQEEKLIVIREYNEFTETALIAKIKTLNFTIIFRNWPLQISYL